MSQSILDEAGWRASSGDRVTALRRMQWVATGLLGLMLALYVVCWAFRARFPLLAYPAAFAQAGMVGACADWFAVVALFRRPFGLPIPHTAILPRNKERLAESLGSFIAGNFLAPAEITPRLAKLDLAKWIADWLRDEANVDLVVECSQALLPPALELAGDEELRAFVQDLIREGIDSIAAAPMAARALAAVVERRYHEGSYDRGVDWAITFLRDNRVAIRAKAAEKSPGWFPRWVDAKATDAFIAGLLETLEAAREPGHPWRREYEAFLDRMIDRLAHDRATYDKAEQIKSDVLDTRLVDGYLNWLSEQAEAELRDELDTGSGVATRALQHGLTAIGGWLEQDERIREMINRWAREVVLATIVPNRNEIGAFITDVVSRWDTATLVERLELHVGKDLQYIRINGTIVGGLVGLALFAVTKFV